MSGDALTDYDRRLLRHLATGDDDPELMWGAAMGASIEFLRGHRYVTGYTDIRITDKGREAIGHE